MVGQKDIINRIAAKTGLKKKDIKEMVLAFKEVVADVAGEGESLWLKDTLMIKPVTVKARKRYLGMFDKTIYQNEYDVAKAVLSKKIIEISKKTK